MYLQKTQFQNKSITSLVKQAIDNNELQPPKDRPYLAARAHFKMIDGVMQYTGDAHKDKYSEVARRLDRAIKLHGPRVKVFTQFSLSTDLLDNIISQLPEYITSLNPEIAVQVINGGKACTPHRDHSKQCSMYYLYTEPDVRTVWWEKTMDFEEFDDLKYGDPDKLLKVHDEIIESGFWYVFNNSEFHSIHLLENKVIDRVALLIEFSNITATDLCNLINND